MALTVECSTPKDRVYFHQGKIVATIVSLLSNLTSDPKNYVHRE